MALGEPEVIHINIGTREDDWHHLLARCVFPVLERNIHETIRNTFEEKLTVQYIHTIYAHLRIYLVLGRGKLAYLLHELLIADIIHLSSRKGIGATADGIAHTYFLAHDEIVGFHKTVLLGEDRQHILIKLKTEKYDEHTEEISKGEACKLRYADMLTK